METGGERVQIIKAHLSNGYAKLPGFVFADFAGHDFSVWETVKAKADDVVNVAELCRCMV